ncbi:MAG: hypothetical protein COX19_00310, partial [Desulfobacterales bacterium CG23_combo_of_CG06-09_8_20_14_all_51_8]
MIKRSFFGLVKPKLRYETLDDTQAEPVRVTPSKQIQFYIGESPDTIGNALQKPGDKVKNGQKIAGADKSGEYFLSSRSGQISKISSFTGIMGKTYTVVAMDVDKESSQILD